jgi:hypothetical protein
LYREIKRYTLHVYSPDRLCLTNGQSCLRVAHQSIGHDVCVHTSQMRIALLFLLRDPTLGVRRGWKRERSGRCKPSPDAQRWAQVLGGTLSKGFPPLVDPMETDSDPGSVSPVRFCMSGARHCSAGVRVLFDGTGARSARCGHLPVLRAAPPETPTAPTTLLSTMIGTPPSMGMAPVRRNRRSPSPPAATPSWNTLVGRRKSAAVVPGVGHAGAQRPPQDTPVIVRGGRRLGPEQPTGRGAVGQEPLAVAH